MSLKIRPCPDCGGEGHVWYDKSGFSSVSCECCGKTPFIMCVYSNEDERENVVQGLTELWNRRAERMENGSTDNRNSRSA